MSVCATLCWYSWSPITTPARPSRLTYTWQMYSAQKKNLCKSFIMFKNKSETEFTASIKTHKQLKTKTKQKLTYFKGATHNMCNFLGKTLFTGSKLGSFSTNNKRNKTTWLWVLLISAGSILAQKNASMRLKCMWRGYDKVYTLCETEQAEEREVEGAELWNMTMTMIGAQHKIHHTPSLTLESKSKHPVPNISGDKCENWSTPGENKARVGFVTQ